MKLNHNKISCIKLVHLLYLVYILCFMQFADDSVPLLLRRLFRSTTNRLVGWILQWSNRYEPKTTRLSLRYLIILTSIRVQSLIQAPDKVLWIKIRRLKGPRYYLQSSPINNTCRAKYHTILNNSVFTSVVVAERNDCIERLIHRVRSSAISHAK